jgi:phage shock protein PspC (stress-responsive transcriptional regulator)
MNSNRRLTRSTTDRMIGGVCGGLATYLGVDPTLVRIIFVFLVLSGVSPLLYVVLWVVVPSDTAIGGNWTQQVQQSLGEMQERATTVAHEVSNQVQKLSSTGASQTPPADNSGNGPATGPTTRL